MIESLKKYLKEVQNPKDVEKILNKVQGLLTLREEVEYVAVQKKRAIKLPTDCIIITNKRIIFCNPITHGLSEELHYYLWKDIAIVI